MSSTPSGVVRALARARRGATLTPDEATWLIGARGDALEELLDIADFDGDLDMDVENGRALVGRTVTVKIKYADFQIVTRSRTLLEAPADKAMLERVSVELVRSIFPLEKKVRLLGVSLHNLYRPDEAAAPPQLTLGLV